jgi:hypothetical protein
VRRSFLPALLAALVLAPAALAGTPVYPTTAAIAAAPARIPDRVLAASRADVPFGTWGGVFTAASGERVTIYVSNQYPVDLAVPQHWAEFLTSLVHGNELASLTMYLAPPGEISSFCGGGGTIACYLPARNFLVAPGESENTGFTPEAVVTHEYGHHIAAHRSNAPWSASTWGTKRWASYIGVCRKVRRHQLYPGAEESLLYSLNPGEGFAEAYRILNERLLGLAESPWGIVDDALYPDDKALSLLRLDVTQPWRQAPARTLRGTLARTRTFTVATPEDGTLSLRVSSRARVRVSVLVGGKQVAGGGSSLRYTVCGSRTASVRVTAVAGGGPFTLTVATP